MATGTDALPVRELAVILDAAKRAMHDEGLDSETIERITNRVIWGHPEGYVGPETFVDNLQKIGERMLTDEERERILAAGQRD